MSRVTREEFDAAMEQVFEVATQAIDANHAELEKYRSAYRQWRDRAQGAFRMYMTMGVFYLATAIWFVYRLTTMPECK